MEDVIRVKDQFYVLATSSLADDRTRVLKYGDTFAVFNRFGDIEAVGLGEHGLYHGGTRYLSRLVLRLGGSPPQLLRSTILDDNSLLTLDMMNLDIGAQGRVSVARGSLHLFRSKFLWDDTCYEQLRLANFSFNPVEASLSLEFGADFADIFEVRGARREKKGAMLPPELEEAEVVLGYRGRDNEVRRTRLKFSPAPTQLSEEKASFSISLDPKQEASFFITTSCQHEAARPAVTSFDSARQQVVRTLEQERSKFCQVRTSNARLDTLLMRSESDLHMMLAGNPEGPYPYAGVPWFNTVFGRDGILTAMECLWIAPWMAKAVLKYLAEMQATEVVPEEEAEPGKILHEMRRGEMANLKEVPFARYYGSVDATPLFVMLAGAYLERTGDLAFVRTIWPNVLAALDWVDTYGDSDSDGFTEYRAKARKGLVQQGWKDSHDSISHEDGTLAEPPIALCEVQGYVYAARQAADQIASRLGQVELASRFRSQAAVIQEKFERVFWDERLGTYVLALDGRKRPCRVQASNPGHCLFSGIASHDHAARLARTLLSHELFCGWGVRTLGSAEVRYNPMSYHNGSVWPHDNAIIARGLARYGFKPQAAAIFRGLFEASAFNELHRLPELFCGFHQRSPFEGPTLYPVACAPQAWAAGAPFLLLEACLGVRFDADEKCVYFHSPCMPDFFREIRLENLRLGEAAMDVVLRRGESDAVVDAQVLRSQGEIRLKVDN